jgi:RimJ/RimL family protein N-acetyltransferase
MYAVTQATNEFPVGAPVDFSGAVAPGPEVLTGAYVKLRPHQPDADAAPLYEATHAPDGDPAIWTYMASGPYLSVDAFREALERQLASRDPLFFTIVRVADRRPVGVASYLRIAPESGVIEIGNIWFAPSLKRTTAATEAIYLLAAHAFDDLGYRRLEWKCDSLNAASRRAAQRFGFRFEGVFRNHMVIKGRNRDTAWYAITDHEWPAVRAGMRAWLSPANFDAGGRQLRSLQALIERA